MTDRERREIKDALLQCAKENENRTYPTFYIVVSSICRSAKERIEELEKQVERMKNCANCCNYDGQDCDADNENYCRCFTGDKNDDCYWQLKGGLEMEFDKTKVYTAQNADEIKTGSKGYLADNIAELQRCVFYEDKDYFFTIKGILSEDENYRFLADNYSGNEVSWNLFYLVEEPKENKCRPYKDIAELKQDFSGRYNSNTDWNGKVNPMYNPLIWVKSKRTGNQRLITVLNSDNNCVRLSSISVELRELFEDYVYLDGSPCGIEE